MSCLNDIIDLTKSFTLADHSGLPNIVIDLLDTDDSICIETGSQSVAVPRAKTNSVNNVKSTRQAKVAGIAKKKYKKRQPSVPVQLPTMRDAAVSTISRGKVTFGTCPICWDELEKQPLASTRCGHVYCLKCIEEYTKVQKKCPMCRVILNGSSSYHPIFL